MMKNLLEQDFISYYSLPSGIVANVVTTNDVEFDLADDSQLVYPAGQGIAKYKNSGLKEINIINYELYFKALPPSFQKDKENCDLIVYTSDNSCFLLNELTDTQPQYVIPFLNINGQQKGKEQKARSQLRQTVELLSQVPAISQYISAGTKKHCCFFNKQPYTPLSINAVQAFNGLNAQAATGFNLSDKNIESFGFEFWVYSGNQTCLL